MRQLSSAQGTTELLHEEQNDTSIHCTATGSTAAGTLCMSTAGAGWKAQDAAAPPAQPHVKVRGAPAAAGNSKQQSACARSCSVCTVKVR